MAASRTRLSLISFALAGALAFTGCGTGVEQGADSSSSASQVVTDDAKNQISDFMDRFFSTLRSGENKDLSSESVDLLTNKVESDSASSTEEVVAAIDAGLTDEEKQKLIDEMKNGADPVYHLVDHSELTAAQDIMLSLAMISTGETMFEQTATVDEEMLKVSVDLDKVKIEGNRASVPPSAMTTGVKESAQASESPSAEEETGNTIDIIWDGSEWKVDGKKYYELMASL